MTIFTTTGSAFKFVVAFFFRAHTYRHKFSFQKNVLVMLVFLAKKAHVLVPHERTYLSLKSMKGIWNMSVSGCLCGFLRIFRHVSDVKKWCKSWLPFSGLMWQASSEHAALDAKAWIWSWASVADEKHGNSLERFMVEVFQLFLGEGFFGWKFTFVKSTWICEKLVIFLLGIPNHGIHHYGIHHNWDGGFMFFV